MNLREAFDDACQQLDMYKHPNVEEFKQQLNDIIEAAGLGGIMHDTLDRLSEHDGMIYVETIWSTRGCDNSSSFEFPSFILDEENPIKVATLWGLNKKITAATSELESAKRAVLYAESKLDKLKKSLGEVA